MPSPEIPEKNKLRDVTFKKAPRNRPTPAENLTLNLTSEE
jgi:hypothetical protein